MVAANAHCRPNALHPVHLSPAELRAELCSLLALGLVRLRMRHEGQKDRDSGTFRLPIVADQSVCERTMRMENAR